MGLSTERICELPLDVTTVVEGTEVTPIDANHCPGACMFLLKTKATAQRKGQVCSCQPHSDSISHCFDYRRFV